MMETTAHINFIAASYCGAAIIIGVLIAWVTLDYRSQRRTLAELELQGLTRSAGAARSAPATDAAKEAAKEQA